MAELWELSELGHDRFVADPPGGGFLFGGQTMALLLSAASATASADLVPKSLHCSFFGSGTWDEPVGLDVERVNDSRSFEHRLVTGSQHGKPLAQAAVAFHRPDDTGDDDQTPAPSGPGPDELVGEPVALSGPPDQYPELDGIIDARPLAGPREPGTIRKIHPYWARPAKPVPDDPRLAACVTAFTSDYMVIGSSHIDASPRLEHLVLTLTHTIWFHRSGHPCSWLRYDADVVSETGGRFLAQGSVHDRDGRRMASFVQEVLKRPRRPQ